jgi:CRISPR-associated protein Cas1
MKGPSTQTPTAVDWPTRDALHCAFSKVRRNHGCAGLDRQTINEFEDNLHTEIDRLKQEVLTQAYRPKPLLRVEIPKPDGRTRTLRIPAVRDRVLQTAMLDALMAKIDPLMHASSFAYRPGRGVPHALAALKELEVCNSWIIDLDIERFFDTLSHDLLLSDITFWIADRHMLSLISIWIRGFSSAGHGVAQGAPISPLLSNIYLHPVDCLLEAHGIRSVRYADDIVLLASSKSQAQRSMKTLASLLSSRKLSINAAKSKVVGPGEALDYLGQRLCSGSQMTATP